VFHGIHYSVLPTVDREYVTPRRIIYQTNIPEDRNIHWHEQFRHHKKNTVYIEFYAILAPLLPWLMLFLGLISSVLIIRLSQKCRFICSLSPSWCARRTLAGLKRRTCPSVEYSHPFVAVPLAHEIIHVLNCHSSLRMEIGTKNCLCSVVRCVNWIGMLNMIQHCHCSNDNESNAGENERNYILFLYVILFTAANWAFEANEGCLYLSSSSFKNKIVANLE
jgi:hypothetical protein